MINPSTPLIKQFIALIKLKSFDNSLMFIEEFANNIIFGLELKVVKKISHIFNPIGITISYILSQSHMIIHTYPEKKIIHIDLAICNNRNEKDFKNLLIYTFNKYEISSIKIKIINFTS